MLFRSLTVVPEQRLLATTVIVVPAAPVAGENEVIVGTPVHDIGTTQDGGTVMSVPLVPTVTDNGVAVHTVPFTLIV